MGGAADDAVEAWIDFRHLRCGDVFVAGDFAGEGFVEDDASREDIGSFTEVGARLYEFRGGVVGGAEGEFPAVTAFHLTGQAEVADLRSSFEAEENVGGFDVAVEDAGFVCVGEAFTDSEDEASGFLLFDGLFVDRVVERLARNVLHDDVEHSFHLTKVVDADEVGVVEFGHGLGLSLELFPERGLFPELHGEDFDGDFAVEGALAGPVDGTHATLGDEGGDVVGREEFGELLELRGGKLMVGRHRASSAGAAQPLISVEKMELNS